MHSTLVFGEALLAHQQRIRWREDGRDALIVALCVGTVDFVIAVSPLEMHIRSQVGSQFLHQRSVKFSGICIFRRNGGLFSAKFAEFVQNY